MPRRPLLAATLLAAALAAPVSAQDFGFDALIAAPATQSSFTFDRSMLSLADAYFGGSDPDVHRVVSGINSISVHNVHFREEAAYNSNAWPTIENNFRTGNWKHLVNANGNTGQQTDLWLRFEGATIRNVVVLNRARRDMNYISVDCNLRPLDMLHLSGHFGIPKIDEGAVMVPAPPPPPPPGSETMDMPHPELKHR